MVDELMREIESAVFKEGGRCVTQPVSRLLLASAARRD
jgi:hypothetical protein